MSNIKDLSQYNIVGTLKENPNVGVYIASKKLDGSNELYIINRFTKSSSSNDIFKEIFTCYSKKKYKDIVNFFANENYFCVVFKYSKGETIKEVFSPEKCKMGYSTRMQILQNILFRLETLSDMPYIILLNATLIQNLCMDQENNLKIAYNLSYISDRDQFTKKKLFQNIHDIIYTLLSNEVNKGHNGKLQIILDKCKNQLYSSIAELIVDLKKLDANTSKKTMKEKMKRWLNIHKKQVKYAVIALVVPAIIGSGFFAYHLLTKNSKGTSSSEDAKIGDILYNLGTNSGSANTIDKDIEASSNVIMDLTIDPTADINYDDYIVQYGDTFESICDEHYANSNYISAIISFNSLTKDTKLVAGSILRLPNKDEVLALVGGKNQ